MAKIISYKQLTDLIKEIGDNHPIIKNVFFTIEHNINDGDKKFPILFVNPSDLTMVISEEKNFPTQEISLTFSIYDVIDDENDNEVDVFSDTLRCLTDVITILSEHPDLIDRQITVDDDVVATPIYEQLDSNANGWETVITLKMVNEVCYSETPQTQTLNLQ